MMREREKYNEGRTEGRIEGRIEGVVSIYKEEMGLSFNETVSRIAVKFNLPLYEAEENVKKYWI